MASIKQYRGKTWRAIVRRKGFPPKSKTFESKRLAEEWAALVEMQMGVSEFDPLQLKRANQMTVKDIFDRYLTDVIPHKRGRNESGTVRRLIKNCSFMSLRLAQISPKHIRDWRDARLKEVQAQSVNREFNTMSAVFTHAIRELGVPLDANPCKSVTRFKGSDKPRDKRWSDEDIGKILKACNWSEDMQIKTGRDYVGWALQLGVETAMRIGELCQLTVGDFHPRAKYAHLKNTKNGDARMVPLNKKALRYFEILCRGKKPEDKIIPLQANTLGEYVLDVRRACGLEHLQFHDSRHEAATRLSKKLSNVLELSAVTGHRSLKSLKRYYNPTPAEIASKLG